MKQITIAGNIGRDATIRQTQGGDAVASWPVAVEEGRGPEKRTIWFDVSLWGKRGQSLAPYLTKGSKVAISGDLSTREHDGKTYLTVRADQVTLLGGGQDRGEPKQQNFGDPARQAPDRRAPAGGLDDLDSIPFAPEWR